MAHGRSAALRSITINVSSSAVGTQNFAKNFRGRKIVITGGTGFIGSFLTAALVKAGAKVTVLMRASSNPWRLQGIRGEFKLREVDFTDSHATHIAIAQAGTEIIFNLAVAANTARGPDALDENLRVNFHLVQTLLRAAAENHVRKFVQVGSMVEYGAGNAPFIETQREIPISPYSLSKILATHLTMFFDGHKGLRTCAVRLPRTFGPKQRASAHIPSLILACLAGRKFDCDSPRGQLRDLLFVDDAVRGLLAAASSEKSNGEIVNLGSNRGFRIEKVIDLVQELTGSSIPINFGITSARSFEPLKFFMDAHKARRLLNWRAETPLRQGLGATVQWYRSHPNNLI